MRKRIWLRPFASYRKKNGCSFFSLGDIFNNCFRQYQKCECLTIFIKEHQWSNSYNQQNSENQQIVFPLICVFECCHSKPMSAAICE